MKRFVTALLLSLGAGIVDVTPMILQDLDVPSCLSAFVHWLVVGVIICYVKAPISNLLKGLLIGVATALPVVILTAQSDPTSVAPILVMSAVLGSLVGYLGGKFAA